MNERLIRYSEVGLVFGLSAIFSAWEGGADVLSKVSVIGNPGLAGNAKAFDYYDLIRVFILLLASPALGLILTVFGSQLLDYFFPRSFCIPEKHIREAYLQMLAAKFPGEGLEDLTLFSRGDRKKLSAYHQILFRPIVEKHKEVLEYSRRHTDAYRIHANFILAIVLGMMFGLWVGLYREDLGGNLDWPKALFSLPVASYLYVGFSFARRNAMEASHFEQRFLLSQLKSENKRKHKGFASEFINLVRKYLLA